MLLALLLVAATVLAWRAWSELRYGRVLSAARQDLDAGEAGAALARLRPLLAAGSTPTAVRVLAAHAYRLLGHPEKSLEVLGSEGDIPNDPTGDWPLEAGLALMALDRPGQAEPLLVSSGRVESLGALAELHLGAGDPSRALADLERWTAAAPDDPRPHLMAGDIWFSVKDYARAANHYRHALELGHGDLEPRLKLAQALYEQGALAEAAALLEESYERNPLHPDVVVLLARCYLEDGNASRARSVLSAYAQAAPETPAVLEQLGRIEFEENNTGKAVEALERAIALRPNSESARYALALALDRAGRHDEAAEQMQAARRIDGLRTRLRQLQERLVEIPHDTETLLAAGALCSELGEATESARYFAAVLARDPTNRRAAEGLRAAQKSAAAATTH